jgi:hypothetical protein
MVDIILAGVVCCLMAAMGYLGVHVTLHPPVGEREKTLWKWGFGILALISAVLVCWQTYRANGARIDMQRQIRANKPPTAEENATAILTLEKRDGLLPMPSAIPVAHMPSHPKATRHLLSGERPTLTSPAPETAELIVTQSQDVSTEADAPYKTRVVVQTTQAFPTLRLALECDGPIAHASGGVNGMSIGGSGIVGGHPNIFVLTYQSAMPGFTPSNPVQIYIWSKQPIRCDKATTF